MVSFALVPPKPDDLLLQPKIKGKMKITTEDGAEEVYSLADVTNVRRIGLTEGRMSSVESRLDVDPAQMVQGLAPPANIPAAQGAPPSIQITQQPALPSDPQAAFGAVAQQPASATAHPITRNLPPVMYQHIPMAYYGQNTSLSTLYSPTPGFASTASLPCYYPSTWGMPSQANLARASRFICEVLSVTIDSSFIDGMSSCIVNTGSGTCCN